MAVYAIGDVHGCLNELKSLLARLAFDPRRDRLIFVGDLINRGPDSLGCLRFIRDLGDRAAVVLGNHEINVLGRIATLGAFDMEPWQGQMERAPDRDDIINWLFGLPVMHRDDGTGFAVVHAGIHPSWSLEEAFERSKNIGHYLSAAREDRTLFTRIIKSTGQETSPEGEALVAIRQDLVIFTRIRLTTSGGRPVWSEEARKAGLADPYAPPPPDFPFQPWYRMRLWQAWERVIYGHWAAMGLVIHPHSWGLDSGCVYGGRLSAMRLDHPQHPITQVEGANHAGFAL